MRIGIFVNGMKMVDYDIEDYQMALEALNHVYEETGVPHELKIIDEWMIIWNKESVSNGW